MDKAIKRAIEGGWSESPRIASLKARVGPMSKSVAFENEIFLVYCADPLFWKALGKAEGWTPVLYSQTAKQDDLLYFSAQDFVPTVMEGYRYQMFRFVDHIVDGKDIDSFFNQLLK